MDIENPTGSEHNQKVKHIEQKIVILLNFDQVCKEIATVRAKVIIFDTKYKIHSELFELRIKG